MDGKATLLLDLKYGNRYYPKIEERVISILRNKNATDWCIIHSFSNEILQTFHQLDATLILGKLLVGKVPYLPFFIDNQLRYGIPIIPDYIQEISVFHYFINKALIEKTHLEGKKIFAWTVNRLPRMQELMQMGLDGIVTDYPNLFAKISDNYSPNDNKHL